MICQFYFLIMLLINYQSFTNLIPIDYQWFTNDLQFLCTIVPNCLLIVCQSASSFYYIAHIVAITTNYNLLFQCFTSHCQSHSVLYISGLSMITSNLPIHHYHSIGNFLPIGSQYFTYHQFPNGTGKFTNSCQWLPLVPFGNDIRKTW